MSRFSGAVSQVNSDVACKKLPKRFSNIPSYIHSYTYVHSYIHTWAASAQHALTLAQDVGYGRYRTAAISTISSALRAFEGLGMCPAAAHPGHGIYAAWLRALRVW